MQSIKWDPKQIKPHPQLVSVRTTVDGLRATKDGGDVVGIDWGVWLDPGVQ